MIIKEEKIEKKLEIKGRQKEKLQIYDEDSQIKINKEQQSITKCIIKIISTLGKF